MANAPLPRRLGDVAALAALYFIAAKLALLLAIPPGYATAVWPAAGIALAYILTAGNRAWPGILIGSFAANVVTALDFSSTESTLRTVAIPFFLGIGATLQALVGAGLIRRFVGFPNPLIRERSILGFLAFGGPIGCLVSASWGVTVLWFVGIIDPANLLFSWWTWWIGDTIGALIFAPLVVIWKTQPKSTRRSRLITVGLPMSAAFALSVALFVYTSRWQQHRLSDDFERRLDVYTHAVEKSFDGDLEVMRAIESYFDTVPKVEGKQFERFASGFLARHPGVRSFSWNPSVREADRVRFEADVRREDNEPDFRIFELDGNRQSAPHRLEYAVVRYVVPSTTNGAAIGFNTYSEHNRVEALDRARDTGEPVATAQIALVQDPGVPSVLVYLPMYTGDGLPKTVAARRDRLVGYIGEALRIDSVMEASLEGIDRNGIYITLRDLSDPTPGRALYSEAVPPARASSPNAATLSGRRTIDFAGRHWNLQFETSPDYILNSRSWDAWSVLARGLAISGLIGTFMLVVTGHAQNTESQVVDRTKELRESEERLRLMVEAVQDYAIIMLDPRGNIVRWNQGAERLNGYSGDEIIGKHFSLFYPQDSAHAGFASLALNTAAAEGRFENEGWHITKDGRRYWANVVMSAIRDDNGTLLGFAKITRDLSERKRVERLLRENQERLDLALESARMGVWDLDLVHDKAVCSARHNHIFGYATPPSDWSLSILYQHIHPDDLLQVQGSFAKAFLNHMLNVECRIVWPNRSVHWIHIAGRAFADLSGKPLRMIGVVSDITELKTLQEQILDRNAALEIETKRAQESNRLKSEFLANMSHELRTPLNGVIGFTEYLLEQRAGPLTPEQIDHLRDVMGCGQHLLRLINDLLDIAKIEAGRMELFPKPFSISNAVEEVAAVMMALARQKGVDFSTEVVLAHDEAVLEEQKFRQVLYNLLSNAVKFTERGGRVALTIREIEGDRISIAISDSGIGISPENVQRLFVEFQQLDASSSRRYQGTGLGLALTKKIVELHGGSMRVESTLGKGSTFTAILPRVAPVTPATVAVD